MPGTLIYDADCGFCTRSANWLVRGAESRLKIASWQESDLGALGLTEHDVTTAAYWVEDGKPNQRGADAIAKSLVAKGGGWVMPGRLIQVPGINAVAKVVYKCVAKNRHKMPGGTAACEMSSDGKPKKYKRLI